MKEWLSRCKQNKRKTVAPHIPHLMCSLVLLLTISLQLVASCRMCLPYLLVFTSLLRITFAVLQKSCQGNFRKFQRLASVGLAALKKIVIFWRFQYGSINVGVRKAGTLKLSLSFSLKHFFISVAISTQVASAPLRKHLTKMLIQQNLSTNV